MTQHAAHGLMSEGRLSKPPAERFTRLSQLPLLKRELRHFQEFTMVDRAHTVMLVEQGILTREAGRAILGVLEEIRRIAPEDFPVDPVKGTLLLQVESYLFARVGEDVGGRMHTGRSRIDQGATVRRLFKRRHLLEVAAQAVEFQAALLALAERHTGTIMPGYTHMQHAQPWVFGHYLLSFCTRFHDDIVRLFEAYARVNLNPLGTVGLSGSAWPLDRSRTTELLGFSGIIDNSRLGREAYYAAEAIATLSYIMCDLNDLATDLHVWSTAEFGLVELDDGYAGTSSIFPQKKNSAALETVKHAAGGAVTWLSTALATFRAEGTGDQAIRELPVIDEAFETTVKMLDLMGGALEGLIVHDDRMRQLVRDSWCTASNLADAIVRETGLSFRQTHHFVARLVRICVGEKLLPRQVTLAHADRAAMETLGRKLPITEAFLKDNLDAEMFVRTRTTRGGVAPAEVDRLLRDARDHLRKDGDLVRRERERIVAAARSLDDAVRAILLG
ncbi:MAG: argininosuccinate lyase [Alphaproteobacteria bacterium]|nr:argininosuccinate lyase [Alphaproteobacteria bacterium]